MTNSKRHGCGVNPLAAALAMALGVAGMNAHATAANTFATRMHNYRDAVAALQGQVAQYRNRHPDRLGLFAHTHARAQNLHMPQHPAAPTPTKFVTSCGDTASSATTPGTLRYEVVNAVEDDVIDLSACNASVITLTQGALPVAVDNLTLTAGASANRVTLDGNGVDRVIYDIGPGLVPGFLTLDYLDIRNGSYTLASSSQPALGGCIYAANAGVSLYQSNVTGCSVAGTAAGGGGVATIALMMNRSTVSGNRVSANIGTSSKYSAVGLGGGVMAKYQGTSAAYILDSRIENNSVDVTGGVAAIGGGLVSNGATVRGSTIAGNSVHITSTNPSATQNYIGAGGGIFGKYGTQIIASTISGNSVTCSAASTLTYCVAGGITDGGPSGGGTSMPFRLGYSTVSGNHADFIGGGIISKYASNVYQSTITGNSAAAGGAIAQINTSTSGSTGAYIYNTTIAANTATVNAGGIYLYASTQSGAPPPTLTLASSIVANNVAATAGADVFVPAAAPSTVAGSNNLVMDAAASITLPGGTLSADPLLQALANNGGPTRTMALSAGSPALDMGINPKGYTSDQRGTGFPRAVGAAPDIGAFEGIAAPAAAAAPAPALSVWALGMLVSLLGFIGWRRRRIH